MFDVMDPETRDAHRVKQIVAEARAQELVRALSHAVSGASHWRLEAQNLLELIDAGILPQEPKR